MTNNLTTAETVFVGVLFVVAVVLLLAGMWSIAALLLMWGWNTVAPVFWAAAPHLGFWQSLAVCILASAIRSVTYVTTKVSK